VVEEESVHETEEEEARQLLSVAVGDIPPGIDLLSGVRRRRAAHRARLRAALAAGMAGALAVAAAITVAVTVGVPLAQSALAALNTAARLTAAQSYQVTMTSSWRTIPAWSARPSQPSTISGDFSPARQIGEEDGGQVRFVGGYVYTYVRDTTGAAPSHGKSWVKTTEPSFSTPARLAAWLSSPAGLPLTAPQDLLGLLESATQVRETGTVSGPGWTGTGYAFSAAIALGASKKFTIDIRGTVGVDRRGWVRRLDTTITEHVPPSTVQPPGVHLTAIITTVQVTLGDFGLPVSVTAPPASDVFTPPTWPIQSRR
jgi:hypothetical protein